MKTHTTYKNIYTFWQKNEEEAGGSILSVIIWSLDLKQNDLFFLVQCSEFIIEFWLSQWNVNSRLDDKYLETVFLKS